MQKQFKKLLKDNKISVVDVSLGTGLSPYTIHAYRSGAIKPSLNACKNLIDFFKAKGITFDPFKYF